MTTNILRLLIAAFATCFAGNNTTAQKYKTDERLIDQLKNGTVPGQVFAPETNKSAKKIAPATNTRQTLPLPQTREEMRSYILQNGLATLPINQAAAAAKTSTTATRTAPVSNVVLPSSLPAKADSAKRIVPALPPMQTETNDTPPVVENAKE